MHPVLICVLLVWHTVQAWYLPGVAPIDYSSGDSVDVFVNRLTSSTSENFIEYDYYSDKLKFCKPESGPHNVSGSLSAMLLGGKLHTSPIDIKMLQDDACHKLCTSVYKKDDLEFFKRLINDGYRQHWLIDSLPAIDAREVASDHGIKKNVSWNLAGFLLGHVLSDERLIIYNHYNITLDYHKKNDKFRVVGVQVESSGMQNGEGCAFGTETKINLDEFGDDETLEVEYSYSVTWRESDTPWATRWDHYLNNEKVSKFRFFVNISAFAVIFSPVILNFTRRLRKDIYQYNDVSLEPNDFGKERRWELVAGDVFRKPRSVLAYSIMIGSGVQILTAFAATLVLSILGFISPTSRGSFSTALLVLTAMLGGVGGWISAVSYKTWGGQDRKANLLLTSIAIPILAFSIFLILDLLLAFVDSSEAVPIGEIFAIVTIWGCISAPISIVFGFIAFKKPLRYPPTMRVNQIARLQPPKPWYTNTALMILMGAFYPFGAVGQFSMMLALSRSDNISYMLVLLLSCSLVVILSIFCGVVCLYTLICNESYKWHWPVFFVSGAPALHVYWLAIVYGYDKRLYIYNTFGIFLYLGYSFLVSTLCFLALGSIGSVVAYLVVRVIYNSIRNK
ncbi:hypothetical protein DASB73_008820 [Starmerella bacillaris]|uniref:Transmembrane 9 superfamily member n=1 Tax=Starmerella bacillaris TaxID=1247836 RepID=A0AAV5RHC3_STABA|nr:hypothetical protein DASB73_008820 [Starmerella bacillaris]